MNSVPIYLLNSSFQIQAVFDDYESAYYTRSLYRPGKFEIRINYNKPNASLFARDLFVLFGGDTRRVGVITSVKKRLGRSGKIDQVVYISGYELRHIFERRITIPPGGQEAYTDKDVTETVIKGFLANQCIGSADANRNFAFLTIAADSARGPQVEISARLKNVGTTLWDICEQTDVGIKITASGSSGIVDTVHGVDRRSSQSVNPRAIFSISSDTAGEGEITDSDQKYRNLVYAAGQGEGVNRTILEVYSGGEPTGLTRREMYLDARDLEATADLQLRAENKLAEYGQTVTIDAEALQYSALQLGTDYDLGDLCTIEALGVTSDVRITEVKESWAVAKYEISLSFGKPQATITNQVAQIYSTGQSIQNFSEFGQNSSVTNIVPTIAPKYLGRYLASHPSSYNPNDWWTVYDSDDSPIQRGVWYSNAGTPTRITTSSSAALQGKLVEAFTDVGWAEDNGYGVSSDYAIAVLFQSVAAVSALIDSLIVKKVSVLAGGFMRGGDRYNEDGTTADETVPGFYIGADGECKVAGIAFEGEQGGGVQWAGPSLIGAGLTISGAGTPGLAALNGTDVAFLDNSNDSLRLYRWSGSAWALVGSGLTITGAGAPSMSALNATDIAYIDSGLLQLRVYRWSGSAWSLVGSGLSIASAAIPSITAITQTEVAYFDIGNQQLRTYTWSGSAWSQVGSGLSISAGIRAALATLNATDIAFIDGTNEELRTYRWSGSTWSQIGSGLSIPSGAGVPAMAAVNGSDVVYIDSETDQLRIYRWSGSTWAQIKDAGSTGISGGIPALAALNGTDVAYFDATNDALRTYRFGFYLSRPYSRKLTG